MYSTAAAVLGIIYTAACLTGSTEGLTCYRCSTVMHWKCDYYQRITKDPWTGDNCQTCTRSTTFGATFRSCSSTYAPNQCVGGTCDCNTDLCNASVAMATSLNLASLIVFLLTSHVF
ncbi:uncharacterized protein LOC127877502 [Dreissena polymorpha]|uniref:uncharacterized protein LOC127877502 n=1 Tax=Dreissena polymorpha TaxID=45954 RepID=UPI002264A434|nr:uncharacterized protein LOC127877502 [Dreissena polymorpha]